MDHEIPTEEKLQEYKEKALLFLNDIKTPLEETMTTTKFQYMFSGSAVERFGIPVMMSPTLECHCTFFDALRTDLDIMFCSVVDEASFSDEGNILIEPLVAKNDGFTGYAQLTSLTPGYERKCVSSKLIREQAIHAVGNMSAANLPSRNAEIISKGPAMKLRIAPFFEADITPCIQCSEWPTMSDWPSRPRYWPCIDEARRIISLGCHLVAKPASTDKDQTSWRFSFSVAEVELSKLVPDAARKCFLALKIIFKDHLQPVVPEISSYHIKTIFLNTLEKVPVGFWVESNIEECLLTLLAELRNALASTNCPHHWFSFINLFNIKANELQRLAKKVERIMKDPAPFILDDGCCCLSPCCVRVPHYKFIRRSSEQFLADYDEVAQSADGHIAADRGNHRYQLPVSPCSRPRNSLHSSSYPSGIHGRQETTRGREQLVVALPPVRNAEEEPSSYTAEDEDDSFSKTLPLVVALPPLQQA